MASGSQTFDLHGASLEVPIVPVTGLPLTMDGRVGTFTFDITNPKEEPADFSLDVKTTGFSSDLIQSFVPKRENGAVWPGAGLRIGAGVTERIELTVHLSSPLREGHEGGLFLEVTEVQ